MRVTFTLDDVIRAKTVQFGKIYQKNIDPSINLMSLDFTSGNLKQIFNFKTRKDYEKFLYEDYTFEVFGEASVCTKQLDKKMNLWLISLQDEEIVNDLGVEFSLSNTKEFNASIGFTYFFLAKIATRIRNVFFPEEEKDIWEKSDVVITADPTLLNMEKEKGKVSVRIENDYNKDCKFDLSYPTLEDLMNDETFFEKIKEKTNVDKTE